jgi:hypothetical protein
VYSRLPAFVIGFHGCDRKVGEEIIAGRLAMRRSENNYDWLGNGFYFWEGNYHRALEYAQVLTKHPRRKGPKIETPYVVGAVIDLRHCLNLLDHNALELVRTAYTELETNLTLLDDELPKNIGGDEDLVQRHLDCAVIETLHESNESAGGQPYDSVRSVFCEGKALYPNAGFREKNHIQICVRSEECIKGFFLPRMTHVAS